jgi:glycosyltransferase involved in cell wall biosynthesis
MRIAIYCSPAHPVPPKQGRILAPWVLAGQIADQLVDRGHQVDLYAGEGSRTKANLISEGINPDSFYLKGEDPRRIRFFDSLLASKLYLKQQKEHCYDVIHVHHPIHRTLYYAPFVDIPTIITLHNPMQDDYIYETVRTMSNVHLVPISHNQANSYPNIPYTQVVYNGIDTEQYAFNATPWDYLLIAGRIVPEKGFHTAIKVAQQTGQKLIIAGEIYKDEKTARYWSEQIEPHIDNNLISYAGALPSSKMVQLYQRAKALLFPIEWEEPFGLVMTEAMSCGTPVIAFRRGSVPEIIKEGKTGFIVRDEKEMAGAIGKISQINRQDCRQHVESYFSIRTMIDGYEQVYQKAITKSA